MPKRNLAIFDLDYTLTQKGTWGRFVWLTVKRRPHIWLPLLVSAGWHQFLYKQGKLPRIRVKQAMMRWAMVGKPKTEMLELAQRFAQAEVPGRLKPGGVKALEAHDAAGDEIMIASAAVDILVEPICALLGVKYWVATDMAWTDDDRLSPNFASANCYNEEKLSRIKALIAQDDALKECHPLISYSDSKADMPLLEFCERGVAIDPKAKFREIAEAHPTITIENWV